jgi:uncharacterized protein YdbL (DUF1318 family)
MDTLRAAASAAAALLAAACVTVNIYFPAAAAEKAADQIIQEVWGQPRGEKPTGPPTGGSPSGRLPHSDAPRAGLERLLELTVAPAYAQPDINISTPAIERLSASMKARHGALEPYYRSGAIGLTRDGLLAVRDLKAVPLPERGKVHQLVADENQARNTLHREIAGANGHPEWEPDIRTTFAKRWIANARPGWWHQNEAGQWRQK